MQEKPKSLVTVRHIITPGAFHHAAIAYWQSAVACSRVCRKLRSLSSLGEIDEIDCLSDAEIKCTFMQCGLDVGCRVLELELLLGPLLLVIGVPNSRNSRIMYLDLRVMYDPFKFAKITLKFASI